MPKKIILCGEISDLYNECFINKKCHHDNKKIVRHNGMIIDCVHIRILYKLCK